VHRDPELVEAGKPTCFSEEILGYVRIPPKDTQPDKPIKEEPLKLDDHSMDTARYVVAQEDLKKRPGVRWL
jgi:hypothetical protein